MLYAVVVHHLSPEVINRSEFVSHWSLVTGTVSCSSAGIKVLPVADDDSCEIKVNGAKPGTVTVLNVGATFVRLEVKSPDGSNSQVNLGLLLGCC